MPLSFDLSQAPPRWTNGGLQMQLDNLAGVPVVIDASTNLFNWVPIYTNPAATGSIRFLDTNAAHFPFRFYRAQAQ